MVSTTGIVILLFVAPGVVTIKLAVWLPAAKLVGFTEAVIVPPVCVAVSHAALLEMVGTSAGFVVVMLKLWAGGVVAPTCQLKLRLPVGTFTVPIAGVIVI